MKSYLTISWIAELGTTQLFLLDGGVSAFNLALSFSSFRTAARTVEPSNRELHFCKEGSDLARTVAMLEMSYKETYSSVSPRFPSYFENINDDFW